MTFNAFMTSKLPTGTRLLDTMFQIMFLDLYDFNTCIIKDNCPWTARLRSKGAVIQVMFAEGEINDNNHKWPQNVVKFIQMLGSSMHIYLKSKTSSL